MKKNFLLFLVAFMAIQFNTLAQPINIPGLDLPGLIITEVRPDGEATAYIELTNIGDTPINLATSVNENFVIESVFYNTRLVEVSDSVINWQSRDISPILEAQIGKVYLKGIVQPGESYVVATVWDQDDERGSGIPIHNTAIAEKGNQFVHKLEDTNTDGWINKPEWQTFGKDSVYSADNPHEELLRGHPSAGYLIRWNYTDTAGVNTATYLDQFNFFHYPDETGSLKGHQIFPISGVEDAMTSSVMVRKANIQKGNMNWEQSRGTDAQNSEWLVVPKTSSRSAAFTTVGVHGTYDLNYTVKDPSTIILDGVEKSISIPWEIVRGDALASYFDLGPGMSWGYDLNTSVEDSASYIARTGDRFTFYAVGNELKQDEFTIEVRKAKPDVAMVFPRRRLDISEELVPNTQTGLNDTIVNRSWSSFFYSLEEGVEIDSIINVAFATRIDSLYKYLDKPADAQWEIDFVDGASNRVDLVYGDKLIVTSEDRSTVKAYFVKVDDHVPSQNALLSAVTWPDIDKSLYPRWITGDTLPDFSPLKTEYTIELIPAANQIPAFHFKAEDLRSKIVVNNAIDIDGSLEQRTTSVTVFAESDTTTLTYNFIFKKRNAPIQPNMAEPFISQFLRGINTQGYAVEIYNPGTEDLDLSRYMLVRGNAGQSWQQAVSTLIGTSAAEYANGKELKIYKTHYVPSKRWAADRTLEEWAAIPDEENPFVGQGFLTDDNQTDPWVEGGDVFVMGIGMNATNVNHVAIREESDFIFRGNAIDNTFFAWDSTLVLHRETPLWTFNYNYLLKVLNDSVLDGTKKVTDPADYELIDRYDAIDNLLAGVSINSAARSIIRKASVSKGNVEAMGGPDETAESSEWIVIEGQQTAGLGLHVMNPITNYLSTVTSLKFIVTAGFSGENLSITGNITDYTPTTIAEKLDKADFSQTFEFKRGETVLTADQNLADGDVLEVTSGDGRSKTTYKLINSPLDDNTSLIAKAGSGLTVINSKVSGVTFGMTLKEAIAKLEVAPKSILNVLDVTTGALQPLALPNIESMMTDVKVSNNVLLQVVAENSDSWNYSFDFGFASDEAVLGSNILNIDQDKFMLMELPINSTAPSLLSMLFANEGASIRILDKAGFERKTGFVNVDDKIEVTAPDGIRKVFYSISGGGTVVSYRSVESTTKVVLFPMPVTSVLNIQGLELASVEVFSLSGTRMIYQISASNSVEVSNLPLGIYIIKMTDVQGQVAVEKFLKK